MTTSRRSLTSALADDVLGNRPDAKVVKPILVAMFNTSIQDFDRYYLSRYASTRVRDTELVMLREKQRRKELKNLARAGEPEVIPPERATAATVRR